MSVTQLQARAWWQVDLASPQAISTVDVYNRTDEFAERLSDYWVFVSTQPFDTSLTPAAQATAPGVVAARHETAQAGSPTTIPLAETGRYVMVQLTGTNYLQLAEVVVND